MMKLLMGLMLLVVSGAASAEWTAVGDNEEFTLYVDRSTIRKNGNLVKMWTLIDRKKVQVINGKSDLSQRAQYEYDCKEERVRFLAFTDFSGQMLSGTVNYTDNTTREWIAVPPGSIGEIHWKIACGKE